MSVYPKESEFLVITSGSGVVLTSRMRGIPGQVDTTEADVSEEQAIEVAKSHAQDTGIDGTLNTGEQIHQEIFVEKWRRHSGLEPGTPVRHWTLG